MAHIGMKNPVAAKWAEGNKYTEGFVVAKAINFTGTPNKNEVELFGETGETAWSYICKRGSRRFRSGRNS